jgi:hypothetical protein
VKNLTNKQQTTAPWHTGHTFVSYLNGRKDDVDLNETLSPHGPKYMLYEYVLTSGKNSKIKGHEALPLMIETFKHFLQKTITNISALCKRTPIVGSALAVIFGHTYTSTSCVPIQTKLAHYLAVFSCVRIGC